MDDTRPFPIQADHWKSAPKSYVPWWLAQIAYEGYTKRFPGSAADQSLEKLAERGGFGRAELIALIRNPDSL